MIRSFFRNLSITNRIALTFLLLIILSGLGSGVALINMYKISEQVDSIVNNYIIKIRVANEVRDEGRQRSEQIRNMLLTEDEAKIASHKVKFDKSVKRYTALILDLNELISGDEERALMDKIRGSSSATFPVMNEMIQNIMDGFADEALEVLDSDGERLQGELLNNLNKFVQLEQQRIDVTSREAEELTAQISTVIIGVGVAIFISILIIWFFLARSLTIPIRGIVAKMKSLRDSGDFSIRCDDYGRSELGELSDGFNSLLEGLQNSIEEIRAGMAEIAAGHLGVEIETSATGDLAQLHNNINLTMNSINSAVVDIRKVMGGVAEGDFSQTVSVDAVSGDLEELANSINDTVDVLNSAIANINQVMSSVAEGNFLARVEVELSGDLNTLKEGLNDSLDGLSSALERSVEVAVSQSEGDMMPRVTGSYSGQLAVLKDAINISQQKVSEAIGEISSSVVTVANSSIEISRTSGDLNKHIQEQAAATEETAASMEQMTASVEQNSDNAGEANQLASKARNLAEQGGDVMEKATVAMSDISSSSSKIADIITVIDSIAFQTNLLALNAAVEAARAGEQGRGFAVVAGEVRSLAQRSAEAAKEITALISDSNVKVDEGAQMVDKASNSLDEIVTGVKQVSDIVAEIAAASSEQKAGIEQVNNAIRQMEALTQDNVAIVDKTATASKTMQQQAEEMRDMISFFKIDNIVQATPAIEAPLEQTRAPSAKVAPATPKVAVTAPKATAKKSKPAITSSDDEWDEF